MCTPMALYVSCMYEFFRSCYSSFVLAGSFLIKSGPVLDPKNSSKLDQLDLPKALFFLRFPFCTSCFIWGAEALPRLCWGFAHYIVQCVCSFWMGCGGFAEAPRRLAHITTNDSCDVRRLAGSLRRLRGGLRKINVVLVRAAEALRRLCGGFRGGSFFFDLFPLEWIGGFWNGSYITVIYIYIQTLRAVRRAVQCLVFTWWLSL